MDDVDGVPMRGRFEKSVMKTVQLAGDFRYRFVRSYSGGESVGFQEREIFVSPGSGIGFQFLFVVTIKFLKGDDVRSLRFDPIAKILMTLRFALGESIPNIVSQYLQFIGFSAAEAGQKD